MTLLNAFRDFADGLTRGLGMFFSERNDHLERTLQPRARQR